ncbi:hypothetical protein CPB85DRAFT_1340666 [Mucidula mucida]|nr:hypothetical protein CPB85DRAFT_1340666 [Mucidula mucida]
MVDWQSPATLQKNAASFTNLLHALLGVYVWEWANTLDFEWALITGKQKFSWPLIFSFYCRYSMLGGLIGFTISLNETTLKMNCDVLYRIMQFLGNTALGAASINLSIRTMAIYKDNKYIVYPLIAVILGHWGIIIKSITNVNAAWVDSVGCTTTSSDPKFFIAMYAYTMVFDFIVLCLLAYKLRVTNRGNKSQIAHTMFVDGLGYFFMAYIFP